MVKSDNRRAVHLQAISRLVLLLAIPVLVGLVMWLIALQPELSFQQVQRTLTVEISLERLISDLKYAGSSQRGYLLTGEERFLESCRTAGEEARLELSELSSLTMDDARQQQLLAQMRPLLDSRSADLQSMRELYRNGSLDEATAKRAVDQDKSVIDSIQLLVNQMHQEEERLLHAREEDLRTATVRLYWSLFLGYGLIVLVVASLYRSVKRHGLQSAAAEARLSKLNAELDERIRERTALLNAREELLSIFVKYVPAAVAMLDREMRYLQVSERWCTDYSIDRSQFIGNSHYEIFPDIPERWKDIYIRSLAGETLRAEEDRWDHDDGRTVWLRWEIRPWGQKNGLPEGILIFSEDITSRKQIEDMLRESEATIRTLLDTASQAILAVDVHGTIVLANRMVGEMFGYAPNELLGQKHEILVPDNLMERHLLHRESFHANPVPRVMGADLNLMGLRKDGSVFPIEVTVSGVNTKQGLIAVRFVSDITARKQAETALRESEQSLRALAGSLISAQEEERRNLARELHDDVTQQLAFLAIELGRLASELPASLEEARSRIQTLQHQTLRASADVRRLSHGLHPSVITDFGLSIALEEFCDEFERVQGVHVKFDGPVDDSQLDAAGATCLYRIAQESMRNAAIHGHAVEIGVILNVAEGFIQLRVADNGRGFSLGSARGKTGLGFISMMERIRLVNGTLVLSSQPGQGTVITASVPLAGGRLDESKDTVR